MNVPVGSTTKVGWGAAAVAFGASVLTYLTGDHTAQETTSVELAGGSLLLLGITHGFRYLQALVGLKLPGSPDEPVVGGKETAPTSRAAPEGTVADGGDGSQV